MTAGSAEERGYIECFWMEKFTVYHSLFPKEALDVFEEEESEKE